jgi:hypothetical protein
VLRYAHKDFFMRICALPRHRKTLSGRGDAVFVFQRYGKIGLRYRPHK